MPSISADSVPMPDDAEAEAKAAFHLRLRTRGLRDLAVLRAMELVPRRLFVPHRYFDLAERDLALPIGCGQTLNEPWLIGRMIEALAVRKTDRVLQIGAGTGYATAILAHLGADVIGLERFQSLAGAAQTRLAELGLDNAAVVWGDGLALPEVEPFDRILVHAVVSEGRERLMGRLAPDGIMVAARPASGGAPVVTRMTTAGETIICPCRLQPLVPGLATI